MDFFVLTVRTGKEKDRVKAITVAAERITFEKHRRGLDVYIDNEPIGGELEDVEWLGHPDNVANAVNNTINPEQPEKVSPEKAAALVKALTKELVEEVAVDDMGDGEDWNEATPQTSP